MLEAQGNIQTFNQVDILFPEFQIMACKDSVNDMSLQYTNHSIHLSSNLTSLLKMHTHCDVVLACKDGPKLSAHKIILSACSTYFRDLLADTEIHQETIIVLKDINREDMEAVLNFLYSGSVEVPKDRLADFLLAASLLKIEELTQHSTDSRKSTISDIMEEIEVSPIVKIEPEPFLNVLPSENIESIVTNKESIKVEAPELESRAEGGSCTLQVRTDILSSVGSNILKSEPPINILHQQPVPSVPESQINFPETAQELVRNRIFGWNQKRSLAGLESAEKILTKKPCVCTQCGARFSYRNQLTEHKRTAHD